MVARWSTTSTLMMCLGGPCTQGLVKPPGERSTISAMLTGMNFRALCSDCFHDARREPLVRRFLPRP
jgi:hypothetical protein